MIFMRPLFYIFNLWVVVSVMWDGIMATICMEVHEEYLFCEHMIGNVRCMLKGGYRNN